MGARIAHDLAAAAPTAGGRVDWLGLSGHAPVPVAAVPSTLRSATALAGLTSTELRDAVAAFGALPASVTDAPDLWDRVEARLRHHLGLLAGPLAAARLPHLVLDTFAGAQDVVAPPAAMTRWHPATGAAGDDHVGDGGHFWFAADPTAVPRIIERSLTDLVGGL